MNEVKLNVNLGGLKMKNPVTTASGTFGSGLEYAQILDLNILGAVTVKGITLQPREGNPSPRLFETSSGLLNAIGLMNPGVEVFLTSILPMLEDYEVPIIVNISGNTIEEYAKLAEILSGAASVSALEVNISCPNIKAGGLMFGTREDLAFKVTEAVREKTTLPLLVKLSPNVTDITAIAKAVKAAGADAISMINTLLGMAIDIEQQKPVLGNVFGDLSGPAIKPVALRCVWQVAGAVDLPILAMGGISNAEDALEFILAGASAVAVGTGNFIDPRAAVKIIAGLEKYCINKGLADINLLVGKAHDKD